MLNMRIVRAPLKLEESQAILHDYNRLTSGHIPLEEFIHWVTKSPEGPAWHALLENEEGRIVGHTSVFPLRTGTGELGLIPAKSEYSFLHEDFRKEKIRGHETASRPAFIILLDHLFRHCQEQGWGPIFASTNDKNQLFTRKVGLRPIEFPLWECLLILKPARAARVTPNLNKWQRAGLFTVGVAHGSVWPLAAKFLASSNGMSKIAVQSKPARAEQRPFSFFEDELSLEWRYLNSQYLRIEFRSSPADFLIAKRGSSSGYLRVLQWQLNSIQSFLPLFGALVREARQQRALGLRWAVYDGDRRSRELVGAMKRAGFLCARRIRTVMIHKQEVTFLDPSLWNINDSLFSFDP